MPVASGALFGRFRAIVFALKRIVASDAFARPDDATTLGSAETGQPWAVIAGSAAWGVSSSQGYNTDATSAAQAIAVETALASCTIQVDAKRVNSRVGLLFRAADSSNYYYFGADGSGNLWLRRRLAGTDTTQQTTVFAWNSGTTNTLKVVLSGSSIQAYANGVLQLTHTDTNLQNNTKHGLYHLAAATTNRWDNFTVTRAVS